MYGWVAGPTTAWAEAVAKAALSCAMVAVICVGLAAASRSTTAAIITTFVLFAVGRLGALMAGHPGALAHALASVWPFTAVMVVNGAGPVPGSAWAILAVWVAGSWVIGLRRAVKP